MGSGCAEKSWKQRNAEAMDLEVSSDEGEDRAPAAKKPRRQQQANDGSSAAEIQRVSAWNLSSQNLLAFTFPPVVGCWCLHGAWKCPILVLEHSSGLVRSARSKPSMKSKF